MKLKHKVQINVTDVDGKCKRVLNGGTKRYPKRLLKWLFGGTAEVLVISSGSSVEVIEVVKGGVNHG